MGCTGNLRITIRGREVELKKRQGEQQDKCDAAGCNTRCVTDVYDSTARCAVGAASCACIADQNNPGEVMTWDKVADYDGDALNVSPSDYVALFSGALESSPWTADHALADTNKDGSVDLDDVEPIKMLFGQCFDGSAECNGYGEYEYEHYCVKPAPDGALYDPDLPGNESLRSACPRWHNPAAGQFEFIRAKAADTNGDKKIGVADLALIKDKFLTSTNINATPGFEKVDINRDGVINLKELMYVKRGMTECSILQASDLNRCRVCYDAGSGVDICPNFTMPDR